MWLERRQCAVGQSACGSAKCIPAGSVCCPSAPNGFCDPGYSCINQSECCSESSVRDGTCSGAFQETLASSAPSPSSSSDPFFPLMISAIVLLSICGLGLWYLHQQNRKRVAVLEVSDITMHTQTVLNANEGGLTRLPRTSRVFSVDHSVAKPVSLGPGAGVIDPEKAKISRMEMFFDMTKRRKSEPVTGAAGGDLNNGKVLGGYHTRIPFVASLFGENRAQSEGVASGRASTEGRNSGAYARPNKAMSMMYQSSRHSPSPAQQTSQKLRNSISGDGSASDGRGAGRGGNAGGSIFVNLKNPPMVAPWANKSRTKKADSAAAVGTSSIPTAPSTPVPGPGATTAGEPEKSGVVEVEEYNSTALEDFNPTQQGELAIRKGDKLNVIVYYTDGWAKGKNLRSGEVGFFLWECCDLEVSKEEIDGTASAAPVATAAKTSSTADGNVRVTVPEMKESENKPNGSLETKGVAETVVNMQNDVEAETNHTEPTTEAEEGRNTVNKIPGESPAGSDEENPKLENDSSPSEDKKE